MVAHCVQRDATAKTRTRVSWVNGRFAAAVRGGSQSLPATREPTNLEVGPPELATHHCKWTAEKKCGLLERCRFAWPGSILFYETSSLKPNLITVIVIKRPQALARLATSSWLASDWTSTTSGELHFDLLFARRRHDQVDRSLFSCLLAGSIASLRRAASGRVVPNETPALRDLTAGRV